MISTIFCGGLVYLIIKLLKRIYNYLNVRKQPLNQIYGVDSYCIIFGGSDGLGLSLAKEYARQNINLILVSRNLEKLENAQKILEKFNIKVLTYQMDISKINTENVDEIMKKFDTFLGDYNISIMVYNVGIRKNKEFLEESYDKIYEMFSVNCNGNTIMNKYFIERFKKNRLNKRSAIVNLSSVTTTKVLSSYPLYGATKSFQEFLNETLKYENNKNIDFIVFKPSYFKTRNEENMSSFKKYFQISSDECAKDLVKYMPNRSLIVGNLKHEVLDFFLEMVPDFLINK